MPYKRPHNEAQAILRPALDQVVGWRKQDGDLVPKPLAFFLAIDTEGMRPLVPALKGERADAWMEPNGRLISKEHVAKTGMSLRGLQPVVLV